MFNFFRRPTFCQRVNSVIQNNPGKTAFVAGVAVGIGGTLAVQKGRQMWAARAAAQATQQQQQQQAA